MAWRWWTIDFGFNSMSGEKPYKCSRCTAMTSRLCSSGRRRFLPQGQTIAFYLCECLWQDFPIGLFQVCTSELWVNQKHSKIVQSLLTFLLCTSTDCAAVQTFGLCKSTDNGCGYFLGCIWTQIVQLCNSIPTFQKLCSFVAYLNLVGFTHFLCYFFQSKSANFYTFCISI